MLKTLRLLTTTASRIAREQKPSTALDFWAKSLRGPRALASWIEFIANHYSDNGAPPPNTRVLRKPQRDYGRTGRTVQQRVDALLAHYTLAARGLPGAVQQTLLKDDLVHLGKLTARDTSFDLWLGSSLGAGQKHEGELTVSMTDSSNVILTRIGFSLGIDADGTPAALIGGLQGLEAGIDKRVIVKATRTLSGLRPKDAALVAVQSVVKAAGMKRLHAVSNATHVQAAEWFRKGSKTMRDYDAFWIERGGTTDDFGGYLLPLRDYQARLKTAQDPRRIDLYRASLSDQVEAVLVERRRHWATTASYGA